MNNLEKKFYKYLNRECVADDFKQKELRQNIAKDLAEIAEKEYGIINKNNVEFLKTNCKLLEENTALKKQLAVMKDIIKTLEHDVIFWKDKSRGLTIKPITKDKIIKVLKKRFNVLIDTFNHWKYGGEKEEWKDFINKIEQIANEILSDKDISNQPFNPIPCKNPDCYDKEGNIIKVVIEDE